MSEELVEVLLRKEMVEDECVVLLKEKTEDNNDVTVLLHDKEKPVTSRGPVCPHCGGKPMFLRGIGKQYCFNCKKYVN
ncbi:MAG: hypothetical protein QXW23_05735 [Thermofilaceae archaeon]